MIARFIAQWAVRAPLPILGVTLLVTVALGWAASGIHVHTSFDKLLPEHTPEVQDLDRVNEEVGGIGYVVAVVEGDDPDAVSAFSEEFARRAAELEDVQYVEHRFDTQFFDDRALLLLSPDELAELDQAVADRIRHEKEAANPLIVNLLDPEDQEKPPTLEEIQERHRARAPTRKRLGSKDGKRGYVMIKPSGLAGDLAFGQRFVPRVRALAEEMQPAQKAVSVKFTGNYVVRVDENQMMLGDLRLAGVLALFLSVGLVTLWTRRLRVVLTVGVPLVTSIVWTSGLVGIFVGEVNIITGFLVAILVGLGIDFGIHLFMRFMEELRHGMAVEEALEHAVSITGRATATGAATTAAAFYVLSFAEFDGFSEFGRVAAGGVLVAFGVTYLVAPPLYALLEKISPAVRDDKKKDERTGFTTSRPATLAAVTLIGVMGFALFSVLSIGGIEFVTNFRKLQGELEAVWLQDRAIDDLGMALAPALVMTYGLENAQKALDAAHAVKAAGGEMSMIGTIISLADFVPTDQEARLEAIARLKKTLQDPAVDALDPEDRKQVDEALALTDVQPFGVDEIPDFAKHRFLGPDGKAVLMLLTPREPPWDTKILIEWAKALDAIKEKAAAAGAEVWVADENRIAAKIFTLIIKDGPLVLWGALGAVFLLLLIDLRHLGRTLLVLAPLMVGMVCIAGLMRLFGVSLNFLNAVMIPAILGIGIDNAVHIYHRYRTEGPDALGRVIRHTGSAALLATATTAIGFGTMVISHHGGLESVGSLALLGMLSTFVATTMFFPALLWTVHKLTVRFRATA